MNDRTESMWRAEAYRAWVQARKAEAVALFMLLLNIFVAIFLAAIW